MKCCGFFITTIRLILQLARQEKMRVQLRHVQCSSLIRIQLMTSRTRYSLILTVLGLLAADVYAQAPKLVPVPMDVPKPGYEGTPANFDNIPNLEKGAIRARGPFLAPPGVKNIAKGKPVTSSEKDPLIGDLTMVTDGDATQVDGNCVELGPGVQWVQIDLGAPQEIYGVLISHYFQRRVYFSTIVQTADDAAFTRNVQTWFNNDMNNRVKQGAGKDKNYVDTNEGKLVDTKGVIARFVRLYSAGNSSNDMNHYIEVNVFGRPPAAKPKP
jgi:hypothetical protein